MLIPDVVVGQLMGSSEILMAFDLQLVQMSQVTLGADVSEEMRDITESGELGANGALQQ